MEFLRDERPCEKLDELALFWTYTGTIWAYNQ